MKYRVRCANSYCRARRSFIKHPDEYKRPPKCSCGRNEWIMDPHRQSGKEAKKQTNCNCRAFPYFHRYGCKGCIHREEYLFDMAARGTGGEKSEECMF